MKLLLVYVFVFHFIYRKSDIMTPYLKKEIYSVPQL